MPNQTFEGMEQKNSVIDRLKENIEKNKQEIKKLEENINTKENPSRKSACLKEKYRNLEDENDTQKLERKKKALLVKVNNLNFYKEFYENVKNSKKKLL